MSTELTWQTTSTGSADTMKLGELVGRNLKGGEIIELRSDLGGGKTTFVKGLAKGAKSSDTVASPTFTLKKIYQAGGLTIFHYDFYRLNDPGIMRDELAESIGDHKAVTVIEWSDIVKDVLPEHLAITFEPTASDPDERQITFSYPESQVIQIERVRAAWIDSRP